MATRTRSKSSSENRSDTRSAGNGSRRSAFGWGGQTGVIAAAAMAGAAVGIAANLGRKFVVQGMSASAGDWADALAAEHQLVLALFDKLEATSEEQTWMRAHLLTKIKNALGKHALEEENVIYPALRQANSAHDADALNGEHGYVKTYLYELENMAKDDAGWLPKARELRAMLEEHMRMEEEEIFPALRAGMTDEQSSALSWAMNREGLKLA